MALEREGTTVPESIADISVQLFDPDPTGSETPTINASIQVRMSDGSLRVRNIDLANHLTPQRITSLRTFMADLRTKAITEMLPE